MTRRTDGDATGWNRDGPRRVLMLVIRMRAVVPAVGVALLVAGCAERGGAAAPPPSSESAPVTLPDDESALVLQVEYTGGFVTPESLAGRLPLISVYADGRVITEGPVIAIHPGPAWPNVQVQQADPAAVPTLVGHALAAGVADDTDLGMPGVADAPSTRFTVITAEGTTVREVYALSEGGTDPMLTAEQQAARTELTDLLAELTDLPTTLQPAEQAPYEPTAVAALARPWTAEADPPVGERPAVAWPGPALPGEPAGAGLTCVVTAGDQTTAVTAAARGADQLTPWTTPDGAVWAVTFRPLLPHETGCADLGD
jgi:hypothetical protein